MCVVCLDVHVMVVECLKQHNHPVMHTTYSKNFITCILHKTVVSLHPAFCHLQYRKTGEAE